MHPKHPNAIITPNERTEGYASYFRKQHFPVFRLISCTELNSIALSCEAI